MRVLLSNSRREWATDWGGDSTQVVETRNALQEMGIRAELDSGERVDMQEFDLLHVFNIQTPRAGLRQMRAAKQQGVPVALSTIYWDLDETIRQTIRGFRFERSFGRRLLAVGGGRPLHMAYRASLARHRSRERQAMLDLAGVVLPNSYAELELLVREFRDPWLRAKSAIVPNAIRASQPSPLGKAPAALPSPYVLQVGRVTPAKGQDVLIKAMRTCREIPLVFAGAGVESGYGDYCARLGLERGNTFLLGAIPHFEIDRIYAGARVHVLPSYRESPGLATLEAGARGINCVVSVHGPVAEYFGDTVWYCEPSDPESVRQAVSRAWEAPPQTRLRDRTLRSFTWRHAAEATLQAYQRVLSGVRESDRSGAVA